MNKTENLDKQHLFDTAVERLAAQGGPSRMANSCYYFQNNTGRKCAVGILLTDDELIAIQSFAGNTADFSTVTKFKEMQHFAPVEYFLKDMQNAHDIAVTDTANNWDQVWSTHGVARRFQNVAVQYDLSAEAVYKAWGEATPATETIYIAEEYKS